MNREPEITDDAIRGFFGPYRFLSNFHEESFEWEGHTFPTSEHAFQWAKTFDQDWKNQIIMASTPSKAKALGRKCPIRPDWIKVRYSCMLDILRHKFYLSEDLTTRLLATGDKYLEETNDWGDTYWGVYMLVGENSLGKILMQIRSEIRFLKENKDPQNIIGYCRKCGITLTRQNICYPDFFNMYECPRCIHMGNPSEIGKEEGDTCISKSWRGMNPLEFPD